MCWKTRSFQRASQAWRLQPDTAMPSQCCAATSTCLWCHQPHSSAYPKTSYFSPRKHGGWRNIWHCSLAVCLPCREEPIWSLCISECLHLHTKLKKKKANKKGNYNVPTCQNTYNAYTKLVASLSKQDQLYWYDFLLISQKIISQARMLIATKLPLVLRKIPF